MLVKEAPDICGTAGQYVMVADGLAAIVKLTMVSGFCQDCTLYFNKKYTCDSDIFYKFYKSFKTHTTNIWYTFIIVRLPRKAHRKPTKIWEKYDLINIKCTVSADMCYGTELAQLKTD